MDNANVHIPLIVKRIKPYHMQHIEGTSELNDKKVLSNKMFAMRIAHFVIFTGNFKEMEHS